jgi:purine-nucleoside phosphorylase
MDRMLLVKRAARWFSVLLWACLVLAAGARAGEPAFDVLSAYGQPQGGERVNSPADEIAWLKTHTLSHGELDDFPQAAIILYRREVARYLDALGYAGHYTAFEYGFTVPCLVYVVRKPGEAPFAVARGMPGAGGVTVQAAELQAMGARKLIHVGTVGLLSADLSYGQVIISDGSYRDGAAFLLAEDPHRQIERPDPDLAARLAAAATAAGTPPLRATGFTIPIYYFEPGGLMRDLLRIGGPDRPRYVEMEEAPFYAEARLMHVAAASIVVGSDRLEVRDGRLAQGFWDGDLDGLEMKAFAIAIRALAP